MKGLSHLRVFLFTPQASWRQERSFRDQYYQMAWGSTGHYIQTFLLFQILGTSHLLNNKALSTPEPTIGQTDQSSVVAQDKKSDSGLSEFLENGN